MVGRDKIKMIFKHRITSIFLTGGALFLGVLFLFLNQSQLEIDNDQSQNIPVISTVRIGKIDIAVNVADTEEERTQGLSGTTTLLPGTGKLFIFDKPDLYGFWMKDMQYALDIIWIGADQRIVGIAEDISPESYPTVFYPTAPVQYVLEVPAGFSTTNGFQEGQDVLF